MLLERTSPELQSVDSAGVIEFLDRLNQPTVEQEVHSLMVMRHGRVIAEGWSHPYSNDIIQEIFSLSKSFTSIAVGMAIHEGKMSLDDMVVDYFTDELAEYGIVADEWQKETTVRHLLMMSGGLERDIVGTGEVEHSRDWIKLYFNVPVIRKPGTEFAYDSGATYILSVILQKATGECLDDYLNRRLFQPLGINRYFWIKCPLGYATGGYGLYISTESIVRFGQCLLQNGQWDGEQIIPAEWVAEATSKQIDTNDDRPDWHQGYGYQFWCSSDNSYRGDGAFGQFCIVLPEQDMVIAMTNAMSDSNKVMDGIWKYLVPAVADDSGPGEPEAVDSELTQTKSDKDHNLLKTKLDKLEVVWKEGISDVPVFGRRDYRLASKLYNSHKFSISSEVDKVNFSFGKYRVAAYYGKWSGCKLPMYGLAMDVVCRAAWRDCDTLEIHARFINTPHCDVITIKRNGDGWSLKIRRNVDFFVADRKADAMVVIKE